MDLKGSTLKTVLVNKGLGKSNDYSIIIDKYSLGRSINCEIKNMDISLEKVENVLDEFTNVRRDSEGNILAGGNIYLSVNYNSAMKQAYMEKYNEYVDAIIIKISDFFKENIDSYLTVLHYNDLDMLISKDKIIIKKEDKTILTRLANLQHFLESSDLETVRAKIKYQMFFMEKYEVHNERTV